LEENMSKKKTEEKQGIGIDMIVQVTDPIAGEEDGWNQGIGHVKEQILKRGMAEELWGIHFPRHKDRQGLYWYWAKELTVIAKLGTVEDIDSGDLLGKAIDSMAHEIVAQAIDDLADEYPGISKYTIIGSISGGQRVIDCLEEQMIEIIDGIDR
jgi:hypothetical protein